MLYLCKLFLCFIFFSFVGWYLEVLYGFYELKKFVNRGFLIGPLCPIYGVGCVLMYLLLYGYKDDPIVLFIMSIVLFSILEYAVSYLLEKIFKVRWWDYDNMKYNINGRICLEMIIPFGILGLLVVYFVFPSVFNVIDRLNDNIIYISTCVLSILFLVDEIISISLVSKFKKTALKTKKDSTEEITAYVKKVLYKQSKRARRLIEAFPNFKFGEQFIKLKEAFSKRKK